MLNLIDLNRQKRLKTIEKYGSKCHPISTQTTRVRPQIFLFKKSLRKVDGRENPIELGKKKTYLLAGRIGC